MGANCPGIIAPNGHCRIGFQPLPFYKEGNIGVVAKSGTLSYEAVASLTRAGLGQSLCVSVGGDPIAGTDFVDALKVFELDDETHGIALIGEIGGQKEIDAANWIRDYRSRVKNPKPIVSLIAGVQAPRGRVMGHAGAWVPLTTADSMETADYKIRLLEDAGVTVVDHPEKIGDAMKARLTQASPHISTSRGNAGPLRGQQIRGMHTLSRTFGRPRSEPPKARVLKMQQRSLMSISQQDALQLLEQKGAVVQKAEQAAVSNEANRSYIRIGIDRKTCRPAIIVSNTNVSSDSPEFLPAESAIYAFPNNNASLAITDEVREFLSAKLAVSDITSLEAHVQLLLNIFTEKEAVNLSTVCEVEDKSGSGIVVNSAYFEFDDAAYRTNKRQEETFKLRDTSSLKPIELEAEKSGIVYVSYVLNTNLSLLFLSKIRITTD